jgi:hypothetical protein
MPGADGCESSLGLSGRQKQNKRTAVLILLRMLESSERLSNSLRKETKDSNCERVDLAQHR